MLVNQNMIQSGKRKGMLCRVTRMLTMQLSISKSLMFTQFYRQNIIFRTLIEVEAPSITYECFNLLTNENVMGYDLDMLWKIMKRMKFEINVQALTRV